MDIMQPRKVDGEGTYFNSCHLTSETLNNRQASFDVNKPTLAWGPIPGEISRQHCNSKGTRWCHENFSLIGSRGSD